MVSRIFGLFAGLALASVVLTSTAQTWNPLGPYGGRISTLLADPSVNGRVYALGSGGMFRTDDAGSNWHQVGVGVAGEVWALAADVDQPGRLYLADAIGRLHRSDDYAQTWTATGYVAPLDEQVLSIADLPGSTNAVLITLRSGYVYKSTDAGASFIVLANGLPADRSLNVVAADPANPLHLLAGAGNEGTNTAELELYRSVDGGQSWSGIDISSGAGRVMRLAFVPGNRIVAVIDYAIYLSEDGAASWSLLPPTGASHVVALPGEPAGLLATDSNSCRLTHDNFITSIPCDDGLPYQTQPSAYSMALAVTALDGGGYRVLVGSNRFGVLSQSGGNLPWTPGNQGLHSVSVRGLALHPRDSSRLFAGLADQINHQQSLLSTVDNGASWQAAPFPWARMIRTIAIDPTTAVTPGATHVYAGGFGAFGPGVPRTGGLYKSTDSGGQSWSSLDQGMPPWGSPGSGVNVGYVRDLVLDPRSCAFPPPSGACQTGPLNTVYAIADGSSTGTFRVLKSVQGGVNWADASAGLPPFIDGDGFYELVTTVTLAIDPVNTSTLYVGTWGVYELDEGGAYPNPTIANGVFRSTDGGATWTHRSNGLPRVSGSVDTALDVFALAIHPRKPGIVWASTVSIGQASRIYKSLDGGASWLPSGAALAHCDVRDLAVDPAAPDVIYASGIAIDNTEGCLYRSEDGGANWNPLHGGLRATNTYTVVRDPLDQARIVVATNSGVWELHSPPDRIFDDRD